MVNPFRRFTLGHLNKVLRRKGAELIYSVPEFMKEMSGLTPEEVAQGIKELKSPFNRRLAKLGMPLLIKHQNKVALGMLKAGNMMSKSNLTYTSVGMGLGGGFIGSMAAGDDSRGMGFVGGMAMGLGGRTMWNKGGLFAAKHMYNIERMAKASGMKAFGTVAGFMGRTGGYTVAGGLGTVATGRAWGAYGRAHTNNNPNFNTQARQMVPQRGPDGRYAQY